MRSRIGLFLGAGLLAAVLTSGSPPVLAQCTSLECQKLQAPGGQFLNAYGRAASIDGNLAVVTADAEADHGAAYAYQFQAGQWVQIQKIVPADVATADLFGKTAAIVGQRMAIGSPQDDDGGNSSGSVYIYEFDGAVWQQVQKLVASDAQANDLFGWAVSMAGDVLAVSAIDDDDQGLDTGAVYVFRHNGVQWVEEQKLAVSTPGVTDEFGFSVATDGTVIVGGTPNHDAVAADAGAAYVFRFNGTTWVEEQKLLAGNGASDDWLGWSVAVQGDVILVGATRHDVSAADSGAVYLWVYDGASWVPTDMFSSASATSSASFGWSLALDGDRLAVGAAGNTSGQGSVYIFVENAGHDWVESCRLIGSGAPGAGSFNDSLGASVALDGMHVIGGAPFADGVANADAGAAYSFLLDENGHSTCEGPGAGTVPDGGNVPGAPLRLRKVPGGKIRITWSASCVTADSGYGVYEGTIGDFASHAPVLCATNGPLVATLTPGAGDRYYLVVPNNGIREGSYGLTSAGAERAAAAAPCMQQAMAPCQ